MLQESEEQRKQRRRERKALKAAAAARREMLQQRKLGEWVLPSQTGVDTSSDAPDWTCAPPRRRGAPRS